jgi:hypothetical protein
MIRITASGIEVEQDSVPRLHAEFEETGCAMLPGFITPPLLDILLRQLETASFQSISEVGSVNGRVFGNTLRLLQTEPGVVALNFILNRPVLFELARQISDTPPLGHFLGRLHRTTADSDQHIDWHSDAVDFRVLGLDINLSSSPHVGGVFQMRDADRQIRREIADWAPGDAFLFRIDGNWHHRLTRVESGTRTVGVGWFRMQPDWQSIYGYANPERFRQAQKHNG